MLNSEDNIKTLVKVFIASITGICTATTTTGTISYSSSQPATVIVAASSKGDVQYIDVKINGVTKRVPKKAKAKETRSDIRAKLPKLAEKHNCSNVKSKSPELKIIDI